MRFLKRVASVGALLLFVGLVPFTGCDRKEKVLDVETPGGELEVTRDKDDGDVEIEIDDK